MKSNCWDKEPRFFEYVSHETRIDSVSFSFNQYYHSETKRIIETEFQRLFYMCLTRYCSFYVIRCSMKKKSGKEEKTAWYRAEIRLIFGRKQTLQKWIDSQDGNIRSNISHFLYILRHSLTGISVILSGETFENRSL